MSEEKEIGKIYETKNYNKFIKKEWNRDINQNNINKIDKSVKENGWLITPIIVNENYEIIEGQHRYYYAKQNNLPIYYMVIPGLNDTDCQIMNSIRTSWLTADYIKYHAIKGNVSYARLMSLNDVYKSINLTTIVYALIGSHSEGGYNKNIIEGKFECTEEEYYKATEMLDYLNTLIDEIKKIKGKKVSICNAIIFCYKNNLVDMARLKKQILNFSNSINGIVDMESALQELERIYNYGIKKKENIVYISTEWKKRR